MSGRRGFGRRVARSTVAIAVAAAALVAMALPASAGTWSEPYTWGSSDFLGYGYVTAGDNVGTWQSMMASLYGGWSYGYCAGCASVGIPVTDGYYGQRTHDYTVFFQTQAHGWNPNVAVDGVVGTNTWNVARLFLGSPIAVPPNGNDLYAWNVNSTGNGPLYITFASAFATWVVQPLFCTSYPYIVIGDPQISQGWYENCND